MARSIAQRTLRDFLQETEDAISSGRIEAALANCQTILASFPKSLEAQRLLGEVYLAQGRLEDALHAFDWVLTNDPENVIAYCNRAMVSERMSDVDTALDCYQQAYELSRGNGQIRQEFTQLSTKVGQQGFVFSRAGLARLYIRGDLLPQAIQEWEAVLAVTPERLDARTGLLEAYWRDGSLDRVEELATQILRDVAGCLKALLLLAHVTASKDMTRAQTLLQQVEALDPDLVMAQEIFADMLARYPDDPFLKLLKKVPCVLNASPAPDMPHQATSAPPAFSLPNASLPMAEASASGSSPAALPQWDNSQGWGNNAAFMPPFSDGQLQQNSSGPLQQNNNFPWAISQATTGSEASKSDLRQAAASGVHPSDSAMQLSSDITPMMGSWSMQEASSPSDPARESQPEPWEMLQDALYNLPTAPSEESQPEPWEMLQNALHTMANQDQEQGEFQHREGQSALGNLAGGEPSWESQNKDTFAEPRLGSNDSWISPSGNYGTETSDWTAGTQQNSPPSWLSMLTQVDRKETTSATPPAEYTSSASVELEEAQVSSPLELVSDQLVVPPLEPDPQQPAASLASSLWSPEIQSISAASDGDDDDSGFGPAWLKSLGAAILEEEVPQLEKPAPAVLPVSTASEQPAQPAMYTSPDAFKAQMEEQPVADDSWKTSESGVQSTAYEPWWTSVPEPQKSPAVEPDLQVQLAAFESHKAFAAKSQPEPVSSSAAKVEQDLVATLEDLEQQLHAKGFVAMEPNSLAAIAQAEETKSTNPATPLSTQRTSQPLQETARKQPSPSALVELGMMFHQETDGPKPPISAALSSPDAADFPAEPLWLQTLRSAPASEADEAAIGPGFSTPIVSRPVPSANASQQQPNIPQIQMETMPGLIFEPTPASSAISEQLEASNGQNTRANPFLETELETTMKRPAVRLQSMLHSVVPHDTANTTGKVRTSERGELSVSKTTESGNLNYKDRLVKGYQHQLVGDYDEAMQDYRLVIRGAPELLGEVISNLRALLKLAPKYSIGYRVLGDAYMRQGEYLQAMESYNSALTMAKKARG